MKALLSRRDGEKVTSNIEEVELRALVEGEVLIKSEYSSVNFKDALGVTGKGNVFKSFPIVGGIDVAGTVLESNDEKYKKGDFVLVTGCGLGETYNGGYGEFVIAHSKNTILRPPHLNSREAMIYGTAGFTAGLALLRMQQNGQTPEMGPILVTGATGGVGQFAIHFFSQMGFEVHALTGKREYVSQLENMGAKKVIFSSQLELGTRALETVRFGGVVDNLGGKILSNILAHINLWGNVCCIGLAESHQLNTTVMPLILRGVSLLGISSNNTPRVLREKVWDKISGELKPGNLERFVSQSVKLDGVVGVAESLLSRQTTGRAIVQF